MDRLRPTLAAGSWSRIEPIRKRAVFAALGRNEDGRARLEVRLRSGTEGDDRDAVGNRYLLLLTLVRSMARACAAQAMIRPQRPALQQREGAVAPGQDNVGRHVPDNAQRALGRNAANTLTPTSRNSYFATIAAFIGTFRSKRSSGSPRAAAQRPNATPPSGSSQRPTTYRSP